MGAFQRIRAKSPKYRAPHPQLVQTGNPIIVRKTAARPNLKRMFQAGQRCHWCDRETRLPSVFAGHKPPKDMATIDHIYSRINPARRGNRHRVVLACFSCNLQRARDEAAILLAKKRMPPRYEVIRLIATSIEAALLLTKGLK